MIKYPTVLVCIDLREKKPSWLLTVWTDSCCNKLPGTVFLLRVKDSCKQEVHIFLCEFAWTYTRCKRLPQLHFQPLDNHNKFSACNKLKLILQKQTKWQGKFLKNQNVESNQVKC